MLCVPRVPEYPGTCIACFVTRPGRSPPAARSVASPRNSLSHFAPSGLRLGVAVNLMIWLSNLGARDGSVAARTQAHWQALRLEQALNLKNGPLRLVGMPSSLRMET
eukprot:1394550-Rhodomonas_salina.1